MCWSKHQHLFQNVLPKVSLFFAIILTLGTMHEQYNIQIVVDTIPMIQDVEEESQNDLLDTMANQTIQVIQKGKK